MTEQSQTALARTKSLRQIESVSELLVNTQAQNQLRQIAAKHMNPERMMRTVANAFRTTPKLKECEPMSMLGALMTCAQLGLEPNTPLGHAYLVPFWNGRRKVNEVQLIIGYKGYLSLAHRSGVITFVDAAVHYSDDEVWQYERGLNATLRHIEGPQKGDPLHAYAVVKWKTEGGQEGVAMAVLPWDVVLARREKTKGWQDAVKNGKTDFSPWHTHLPEMAMKTAVRELFNRGRIPVATEYAMASDVDESQNHDFARFAMDPDPGGPGFRDEDDDGDVIEGDVVERDEPDEKEQAKKTTTKKSEQKKQDEPEPDLGDKKPADSEKPAAKKKQEQRPDKQQWVSLKDTIISDLLDAPSPSEVLELYEDQLVTMEKEFPDLHAEIVAAAEASMPGDDDGDEGGSDENDDGDDQGAMDLDGKG